MEDKFPIIIVIAMCVFMCVAVISATIRDINIQKYKCINTEQTVK